MTTQELTTDLPSRSGITAPASDARAQPELIRALGVWTSMAVVIGVMVGSGVFLKPAEIAQGAGTVGWAIGAWVAAAGLSLLGALCYLELGTAMPETGGDYVFLKRAWGPVPAFLYGWRSVVISGPASSASQAAAIMLFGQYYWPELATRVGMLAVPVPFGSPITFDITWGRIGGVLVIVGFTLLTLAGMKIASRAHFVVTALKVGFLVAIIGAPFLLGRAGSGSWSNVLGATGAGVTTFSGFVVAVGAALWAFAGTSNIVRVGGEVIDPARTLPRAILAGLAVTTLLYLALTVMCFYVLGFQGVAGSAHVVSDMLDRVGGPLIAGGLTGVMIVSALGSKSGSAVMAGRIPYAVAKDGLFPNFMTHVHPVTRAPTWAVIVSAGMACALALTGSFAQLTGLVVFIRWGFTALVVAGLIRLRFREPNLPRPIRTWGYPLVPLGLIISATVLAVTLFLAEPGRSGVGVLLIMTGLPVYWYMSRRRQLVTARRD